MVENYWPKSMDELIKYIEGKINSEHDYESIAEDLASVSIATFNFYASLNGCSGFQASWAGLQILAKLRNISGPFMIVDIRDMLYPQYDHPTYKVRNFILSDDVQDWLKNEALKKLETSKDAHPGVISHWKWLAGVEDEIECNMSDESANSESQEE